MKEEVYLYDDDIIDEVTVRAWRDRHGDLWQDESAARYASCTHRSCKNDGCGGRAEKGYTCCPSCRYTQQWEHYRQREKREWDRVSPLYDNLSGKYFFDKDSLTDYLSQNQLKVTELQLLVCEPYTLHPIEPDDWWDECPDEVELPQEILNRIERLNEAIASSPVGWRPTKYAARVLSVSK